MLVLLFFTTPLAGQDIAILDGFNASLTELRKKTQAEIRTLQDRFDVEVQALKNRTLQLMEEERQAAMKADKLDHAITMRDAMKKLTDFVPPLDPSVPHVEIPKDAYKFGKHHYTIETTVVTWHTAQEIAKSKGGYLARIQSESEFEFVKNICRQTEFHGGCWVDGTDETAEGTWLFSDGSKANLSFVWRIGPVDGNIVPDNVGDWEHHLELVRAWDFQGNDAPGGLRRPFMIEWDQ